MNVSCWILSFFSFLARSASALQPPYALSGLSVGISYIGLMFSFVFMFAFSLLFYMKGHQDEMPGRYCWRTNYVWAGRQSRYPVLFHPLWHQRQSLSAFLSLPCTPEVTGQTGHNLFGSGCSTHIWSSWHPQLVAIIMVFLELVTCLLFPCQLKIVIYHKRIRRFNRCAIGNGEKCFSLGTNESSRKRYAVAAPRSLFYSFPTSSLFFNAMSLIFFCSLYFQRALYKHVCARYILASFFLFPFVLFLYVLHVWPSPQLQLNKQTSKVLGTAFGALLFGLSLWSLNRCFVPLCHETPFLC